MGKLAEIKDMEEAVEGGSEAKEFIEFTKRQNEHNLLTEKLMKITAGCAAGVLAVILVAAIAVVPKAVAAITDVRELSAQAQEMLPQLNQTMEDVQQLSWQVSQGDPKLLMENLNSLTEQSEIALKESVDELKKAVEVLERIDIDALNKAVDNLGKAVSPLAKLFGGK